MVQTSNRKEVPHANVVGEAREDLLHRAEQIKNEVKEMGPVVKQVAKDSIQELREKGAESISQVGDTFDDYKKSVEEYIKTSPTKSLLLGVGVGVALGLWFSKSSKIV